MPNSGVGTENGCLKSSAETGDEASHVDGDDSFNYAFKSRMASKFMPVQAKLNLDNKEEKVIDVDSGKEKAREPFLRPPDTLKAHASLEWEARYKDEYGRKWLTKLGR